MKQCLECGIKIPKRESFCSEICYDLWVYGSDRTPGYTLLDVEVATTGTRGKKRMQDLPPTAKAGDPIDYDSIPF